MRGFITFEQSTLNTVPNTPGVYIVCLKKTFSRMSGAETNIVYIGKAGGRGGLHHRVSTFFTKSGHGRKAILRFRELKARVGDEFQYFYRVCESADVAAREEDRELRKYKERYWELPPLNHGDPRLEKVVKKEL